LHPLRKQRLITFLVIFFAISTAILLVVRGLSSNLNLFYTPTELKNSSEIKGINIRAGGMVLKDSVVKSKTSLEVQFQITDYENNLLVKYRGVLPDLFSEDAGVVVQGNLAKDGSFQATEVLAKHDENYMPPEVANALKKDDS
tara:strand:+ start:268 stop:696 length:429 start_codon:yes stop_codon:yes gene_type:complete